MRLYDEVARIFASVSQAENAVSAIRREEQGRLVAGVMSSLAGSSSARHDGLPQDRRNVFLFDPISQFAVDRGLVNREETRRWIESHSGRHPYVTFEPLMELSLVCIMPLDHPLTAKSQ